MWHRMAPSTNALSLSKVVLLSPAVPLEAELQQGTPLHWWWKVSAPYTVSYQTLVYLEHSYKETVILNDYS